MPTLGTTDTRPIGLDALELDPKNPRLALEFRGQALTQPKLVQIMFEQFELEELGESFIKNGFFTNEPLLAVKTGSIFRVIEGNRRLAALRLLVDGPASWKVASSEFERLHKEFLKLPTADQGDLQKPTVCVVKDAKRAIGYMGFRHVTGIKPWPALEKAGYIAHLVEEYDLRPEEIAPLIGSKPAYVARHYQAYRLIAQARDEDIVDVQRAEQNFGVFMRALQSDGVLDFIGVQAANVRTLQRNPLKKAGQRHCKELITWAFGTEKESPILRDSRRLTQFGAILRSTRATEYLRRSSNPDFDQAFLFSSGPEEEGTTAIQTAEFALRDAVPVAPSLKSNEAFRQSVKRCADYMAQILALFPGIRAEFFPN
jgi:hypothetical protein